MRNVMKQNKYDYFLSFKSKILTFYWLFEMDGVWLTEKWRIKMMMKWEFDFDFISIEITFFFVLYAYDAKMKNDAK